MNLVTIRKQMHDHLHQELIPFWADRAVDTEYGGYFTSFDSGGRRDERSTEKYVVMQTRMIWTFSLFTRLDARHQDAARQGVDFLIDHFWDTANGGWVWQTDRQGRPLVSTKITYAQSFAIYGLATYYLATGDERGLDYAARTFDTLQKHVADLRYGGYYDSLSADWHDTDMGEFQAGIKTLNCHMHLMEAYTALVEASGDTTHRRRLAELVDLLLGPMFNHESGCPWAFVERDFTPLKVDWVGNTWEPDEKMELLPEPIHVASYGHNLEMAWLLLRAADALGRDRQDFRQVVMGLADHGLEYGLDREHGGVYREGTHDGPAFIPYKEWWQQSETLVGYLDAYNLTGDERYLDAAHNIWDFTHHHVINHEVGEWRTILDVDGTPLIDVMGHPWKAGYHTARAMDECLRIIDQLGSSKR